jgi:hypothetical protein
MNKSSPGMANSAIALASIIKDAYRSVLTVEHSPLKAFDPRVAQIFICKI